jgi:hypothetical protein
LSLLVDQQREGDAGFLPKLPRVIAVAKADRRQLGSRLPKVLRAVAQLCDVLAAEDSAVVAQKHHDCRPVLP